MLIIFARHYTTPVAQEIFSRSQSVSSMNWIAYPGAGPQPQLLRSQVRPLRNEPPYSMSFIRNPPIYWSDDPVLGKGNHSFVDLRHSSMR